MHCSAWLRFLMVKPVEKTFVLTCRVGTLSMAEWFVQQKLGFQLSHKDVCSITSVA